MARRRLQAALWTLTILLALPNLAWAQSWSSEQKEVWDTIRSQWDASMKKDASWVDTFLHDSFQGWALQNPAPRDKAATAKWERYTSKNSTTHVQEQFPLSIVVVGDTAVAHYLWSSASEDDEGKKETTHGRYTDILVKSGGTWKFIAWQGGEVESED